MTRASKPSKSSKHSGDLRIGVSGWRYAEWRGGAFYPKGLKQREELAFVGSVLSSTEINGSFYSLQRPPLYQGWASETPDDFVFALKGPRYVTHLLRLKEVRTALANFFASGPLALGAKLGPILWQLPPTLQWNAELIGAFLSLLPKDTEEAKALGRMHDERTAGRTWLQSDGERPLRHALEVRHPSFVDPAFIALLREHRMALVVADTAGRFPLIEDVTADFVYVRLHGDTQLYASGYSDEALSRWARRIEAWRDGGQPPDARCASTRAAPTRARRDVYCYFDNDVKAHAPHDAMRLAEMLGASAGRLAARAGNDVSAGEARFGGSEKSAKNVKDVKDVKARDPGRLSRPAHRRLGAKLR